MQTTYYGYGESSARGSIMARKPIALVAMAILAGVMALALSLSFGAGHAWAGGGGTIDVLDKSKTVYVSYLGKKYDLGVRGYGDTKVITNVKSSNKKVATAKSYKGSEWSSFVVTLKKTGTTKISYVHAGKKHTVKYIVKKYVNPIKSLTVGGKNYASCFAASKLKGSATGAFQAATNASAFTGKLKVTPKAGWKVTGIYRSTSSGMAKVKNGSTVKKETFLQIELKNKKTGQVESFMFSAMGKYYKDFITMSTSAVSEHEPVATKEPAAVLRAA